MHARPGAIALTLFSTLLLTACQSGPDRPGPGRDAARSVTSAAPISLVFVELDQNHDQNLSRTELEAGLAALFSAADQNGDGALSPGELRAWFIRHLGSEYPVPGRLAFDPDGDNSVSLSEFSAVFSNAFTRMDADGDGVLVRSEMVRELSFGGGGERARRGQSAGRGGGRGPR